MASVSRTIVTVLATALLISGLGFFSAPASATGIVLTDYTANMQSTFDSRTGNTIISLLIDSTFFTAGGVAGGGLAAVAGNPAQASIWLADPFLVSAPDDGEPSVGFVVNPGGEVMGIEPSPFRIFLSNPPDNGIPGAIIGQLDFSGVTGTLGSLNLSGILVHEVDALGVQTGVSHTVAPFTLTQAVPEPSTGLLVGMGGLWLAMGARRPRSR